MADVNYTTPESWTDAFAAANFNALGINGGILSTATAMDNSAGLYRFVDLSFIMVTSTWSPGAGGGLEFYLLPVGHDGSTYPSNSNGTTQADLPSRTYLVGTMLTRATATSQTVGFLSRIRIPPRVCKWYVVNRGAAALPSSSTNMTCKYSRYTEKV